MALRGQNLWGKVGSSLDIQRSDLWYLDLTDVTNKISKPSSYGPGSSLIGSAWWAYEVTLPQRAFNTEQIRTGTISKVYPVEDLSCGTMTVKFRLDSSRAGGSKVFSLLSAWFTASDLGNVYGNTPLLTSATQKPVYRADLRIVAMRGTAKAATDLNPAMSWKAYDCWVSSLTVSAFDAEKTDLQYVEATVEVSALEQEQSTGLVVDPVNSDDQNSDLDVPY